MTVFRVKAFTGPCWVGQIAEKVRASGVNVTVEGTEHVYAEVEGTTPEAAAWNARAMTDALHLTWKPA